MAKPNNTRDLLIRLVEPMCAGAGYDLVDVHYLLEQSGWVVRVFIDVTTDNVSETASVSFKDCEVVSRELSALLDVEDLVAHAYRLEVSSPGLARPLRTSAHFRRFAGERAKISLHHGVTTDTGSRRNFIGSLVDADADNVIIEVDGRQFSLPIPNIASAALIPDWDVLSARKRV